MQFNARLRFVTAGVPSLHEVLTRLLIRAGTSKRPKSPIFFFAKLSPNAAERWYLKSGDQTHAHANTHEQIRDG